MKQGTGMELEELRRREVKPRPGILERYVRAVEHARRSVTERRASREAVWLKPEWHELTKKPMQFARWTLAGG